MIAKQGFFSEIFSDIGKCVLDVYQIAVDKKDYLIGNIELRITKRKLKKAMKKSNSYSGWKIFASHLDKINGSDNWRKVETSHVYDYQYIKKLTQQLRMMREINEVQSLQHLMCAQQSRKIGGILNQDLYENSYIGTKYIIHEYQQEICTCMRYIYESNKLSKVQKLQFFGNLSQTYGRSALLISGGGFIGLYSYGVVKALYEENLLPRIITGSSAGGLIASHICTQKIENIQRIFEQGSINYSAFESKRDIYSIFRKIKRLFTQGYLMDISVIEQFVKDNTFNMTFREAYDKTGWILNITVTGQGKHDSYQVLNYINAPNVLIWSAACASCCLPLVYGPPVELMYKDDQGNVKPYHFVNKKFVDGSIGGDVPTQAIQEMFNVNNFIISQSNPWVIPFLKNSSMHPNSFRTKFYKLFELLSGVFLSEIKHRLEQLIRVGIITGKFEVFVKMMLQSYSGPITVWPIPDWTDYYKMFKLPDDNDIQKCIKVGQNRAFKKISHIKSSLIIEKEIEKYHQQLMEMSVQVKPTMRDEQYIITKEEVKKRQSKRKRKFSASDIQLHKNESNGISDQFSQEYDFSRQFSEHRIRLQKFGKLQN